MVFNVCNDIVGNCEVYRLTFDGQRHVSKCFKKPTVLHAACEKNIFYETALYKFDDMPLEISDCIDLQDDEYKSPEPIRKPRQKVELDDVVPFDSKPDEQAQLLKARIVTTDNGKLKIQCLYCMRTPPNILTHAREKFSCRFSSDDNVQLKVLFARLHRYQKQISNQRTYGKNKEHIKKKARESYAANPDAKKQKSKDSYKANPAKKKEASKDSYKANLDLKKWLARESSKKLYAANPEKKKQESKNTYEANPEAKNRMDKDSYWKKCEEDIRHNFIKKQMEGLSYVCICCHRLLFKTNVTQYHMEDPNDEVVIAIKENKLQYCISLDENKKQDQGFWLCYNCKKNLKDGKMPNNCHANGLEISEIPEALKGLTFVESMMIKKKLIFIKIRELTSSRMKQMNGKIVNVPISDTDMLKSCSFLPRMDNQLGTVNVAFKRRRYGYTYRKPELIRPRKINEALAYLKAKHPSYMKFDIKWLDCPNKYMMANLPLIGKLLENEENLPTLDDAFKYLSKNSLLTEWLFPLGKRSEESYGYLLNRLLIRGRTPSGKDSFLHALMDQLK